MTSFWQMRNSSPWASYDPTRAGKGLKQIQESEGEIWTSTSAQCST